VTYQAACGKDAACLTTCDLFETKDIGGSGPGAAYLCPKESQAFFTCVGAQPASAFSCDVIGSTSAMLNGARPPAACADLGTAYRQCILTKGQDCAVEASVDQSCVAVNPATPHHAACKVNATPPAGCVPFDPKLPGGLYCCP
jgi:hypothetical protein